jgi:hypothetical protein
LNIHYDASQEVRAKGAGFYQFSGDEETRRRQMEELKSTRKETEKTRQETGAVDLKSGEGSGMQASTLKSRAVEKRRLEIEERRKMVEAKRRKVQNGIALSGVSDPDNSHSALSASETSIPADPLAALEVQSRVNKGKSKVTGGNDADMFLALLERDLTGGKAKHPS